MYYKKLLLLINNNQRQHCLMIFHSSRVFLVFLTFCCRAASLIVAKEKISEISKKLIHSGKIMDSTRINIKPTYYIGKILGLFPLTGHCNTVSLFYSFTLWLLVSVLNIYLSTKTYVQITITASTQPFVLNVSTNS